MEHKQLIDKINELVEQVNSISRHLENHQKTPEWKAMEEFTGEEES